jgi:lipopolysaccharide/colanic/teichoic acid biosynthesis glycosyltransferase
MYKNIIKPFGDYFIATALLSLFLPIMALTAIVLLFHLRSAPFFIQVRPGKNGVSFKLIKFKTMYALVDQNGKSLPDHLRLSGIGYVIRKTSLDELPQLLNVLKGDMSIVGPRPLLVEYLSLYNNDQKRRHDVKPGITGWAQVNGRNAITWKEKFEYDVWYVKNQSFWLDIKILFLTIIKVFRADGISSNSSVTMEKFTGNE